MDRNGSLQIICIRGHTTNLLRFFLNLEKPSWIWRIFPFLAKKTSMICCDSLGFSDMKGGKSWDITWKPSWISPASLTNFAAEKTDMLIPITGAAAVHQAPPHNKASVMKNRDSTHNTSTGDSAAKNGQKWNQRQKSKRNRTWSLLNGLKVRGRSIENWVGKSWRVCCRSDVSLCHGQYDGINGTTRSSGPEVASSKGFSQP